MPHPPTPEDPLVRECTGCGADFLASPARESDAILCPACATVQPCGHVYADTVEDAAGQPFCARCPVLSTGQALEERG